MQESKCKVIAITNQKGGVGETTTTFNLGVALAVGNVNLRGKSRSEKLALITQYVNAGYFVTEEVKGATLGNQHWVAVTGVNGNNVIMVDPAPNQTDMWSAYEWSKSSQFNYFKAE